MGKLFFAPATVFLQKKPEILENFSIHWTSFLAPDPPQKSHADADALLISHKNF